MTSIYIGNSGWKNCLSTEIGLEVLLLYLNYYLLNLSYPTLLRR